MVNLCQAENEYPSSYCIQLNTNIPIGNRSIVINVTQNWAPLGANHLYDLITSQFYSVPSAFFRVVPKFVLQFGISGNPLQNILWNKPILDGWNETCILGNRDSLDLFQFRSRSKVEPRPYSVLRHRGPQHSHDAIVYQLHR